MLTKKKAELTLCLFLSIEIKVGERKMKKGKKFTSIIVAALFATSPLLTLAPSFTVQAATGQATVSATDVQNHFLQNVRAFENRKQVSANVFLNNPKLSKNNSEIEFSNDNKLINGRYELQATITVTGFTPSNQDRTFNIVDGNGNIIGTATIPANSSIANGNADFEFSVSNGKIGSSSLGTIKNSSAKKTTVKKAKKHSKKRSVKKHKKSRKKTKKSYKRSRRASRR